MAYTVTGVPLLPQTQSLSCWYASARMIVQWRRELCQQTFADEPAPDELPWAVSRQIANNGLQLVEMVHYASLLGFRTVPPQTPTLGGIEQWLRSYGPLWTAGLKVTATASYGHVVVIVGVTGSQILIHDPEPVNVGSRVWRPTSWLTTTLSLATQSIPTNFMHYPGLACS